MDAEQMTRLAHAVVQYRDGCYLLLTPDGRELGGNRTGLTGYARKQGWTVSYFDTRKPALRVRVWGT